MRLGNRLKEASSRSNGRFVATMMKVESSFMPSHSRRNWLRTDRWVPLLTESFREPSKASPSSIKTTQGFNLRANENIARIFFSLSPTYLSCMSITPISTAACALKDGTCTYQHH